MEKHYSRVVLLTGGRGVGKTTVCQAVAELARRRGYRPGGVITPALYACPEPFDFTQDRRSRRACPEPGRRACPEPGRRACPEPGRRACPADWELGIGNWELKKVGFEAVDVGSGERWPLARTDPSTGSGHCQELGGPRVGPYIFDPAGLARALKVLRRAATAGTGATNRRNKSAQQCRAVPCDLLMVDEIGPLELEQGKGFAPILELLPSAAMESRPTTAIRNLLIVVRPAFLDQLLLHFRDTECTVFRVTEENRDELPLRIVEELWGDE